ncbi:hypothetical protein FRB99_003405 [Tulasnella sp. 403]|nr:hypothetical protein FRB99_003405 [Tulasnella sp. 403]
MPYVDIEMDGYTIRLCDSDFRDGFFSLCGRINISPASVRWYDGSTLSLVQLTLEVASPARPGQNPQQDNFYQTNSADMTTSRHKRLGSSSYDTCIQFGSKIADTLGTVCPFAILLPKSCVARGTRSFTITSKAYFLRQSPPTASAPAQFEVNSNPVVVTVSN